MISGIRNDSSSLCLQLWSQCTCTLVRFKDGVLDCSYQWGFGQAVEGTSSFPLRVHSVHISKTCEIVSSYCPFWVILCLLPLDISHLHPHHVCHFIGSLAPGLGERSAPSLSYQRRSSQHLGEPILKNTSIHVVVLVNSHQLISSNWSYGLSQE